MIYSVSAPLTDANFQLGRNYKNHLFNLARWKAWFRIAPKGETLAERQARLSTRSLFVAVLAEHKARYRTMLTESLQEAKSAASRINTSKAHLKDQALLEVDRIQAFYDEGNKPIPTDTNEAAPAQFGGFCAPPLAQQLRRSRR